MFKNHQDKLIMSGGDRDSDISGEDVMFLPFTAFFPFHNPRRFLLRQLVLFLQKFQSCWWKTVDLFCICCFNVLADYTITDAWQELERSYQPGLVFLKKESGALVASAQFLVVRITFSSYVIKVHWVWEMIFVSMWKYIWSQGSHRPLVCNAWWLSAFKFKRSVTSPNPNPTNVYKHLFTTLPAS